MERVSLFVDFYNFVSSSNLYLNQKCFVDYTKFQNYFINPQSQIHVKTYLYGGLNFGKMLDYLEKQPRIDVIRGEVGINGKEKCTDINLAMGLLSKAFFNSYDVALLFSGDRDYTKLVREIKRMGKIIGIVTPDGESKNNATQLAKHCDFHICLDEKFYSTYWKSPDGQPYISQIKRE